jgi:hypothetical protein
MCRLQTIADGHHISLRNRLRSVSLGNSWSCKAFDRKGVHGPVCTDKNCPAKQNTMRKQKCSGSQGGT